MRIRQLIFTVVPMIGKVPKVCTEYRVQYLVLLVYYDTSLLLVDHYRLLVLPPVENLRTMIPYDMRRAGRQAGTVQSQ